jgi:hypothetical protein
MGYMHIHNLYADQRVLLFKRLYAMEKIDGTSAHITVKPENPNLTFSSGGSPHENFLKVFDIPALTEKMKAMNVPCTVYGEAYGGKMQGKSKTYGPNLKFVVFDVEIYDKFLGVPKAEKVALDLGLEFVPYKEVSSDQEALDAERDADSEQAIRNGMGPGHPREGVVLRPLIELHANNDDRIISKHKVEKEKETKTPRKVGADPMVLETAQALVDEYVTETRLTHVLDKLPGVGLSDIPKIIAAMVEDVTRESEFDRNGVDVSKESVKLIGRTTAVMFKERLKRSLELNKEN